MISIYTRTNNPFTKEFWKWNIKKITKKYSGPDAVLDSLARGLQEQNIPFEINPLKPKYDTIHVVSGVKALEDRIKSKKDNQILIAGPTIALSPTEHDSLLCNEKIDIILTPSNWVKDFYLSLVNTLEDKIYNWPSGVHIPKTKTSSQGPILVYKKDIAEDIFEDVIQKLEKNNLSYEVISYGNFSHQDYISKLQKTPLLIYLQKTESQGLALQEAWAHNVPTLVFQGTEWRHQNYSWNDPKISAPYLTDETGLFFNLNNFEEKLEQVKNSDISPQEYCKGNLSDSQSVSLLFDIINRHEKNH